MIEIERSVLGGMLLEAQCLEESIDLLNSEMFESAANRKIFKAIQNTRSNNLAVDIITVTKELHKSNDLEFVGGGVYVSQLTSEVGSTAHIESYVRLLQQRYIFRKSKTFGEKLMMTTEEDDVMETLNEIESGLNNIYDLIYQGSTESINDAIKALITRMDKMKQTPTGLSGIDTGFSILNKLTNGWQESDLITLAARPGMGKTSLALNFLCRPALGYKIPTAFFSLEMSKIQIAQRLISQESGIELKKIIHNELNDYETNQFNYWASELNRSPIYIDDKSAISIPELRSKVGRLKRESNIRLVVIDYLQLMRSGKNIKEATHETTAISNGLKQISKEFNIPVIALSQLSRDVEKRGGDKRPQLSDLRQSGSIEQDSDMVIFLYRPEYYGILSDEQGESTEGLAELEIAKYRNGSTGTVRLNFIKSRTTFENRHNL